MRCRMLAWSRVTTRYRDHTIDQGMSYIYIFGGICRCIAVPLFVFSKLMTAIRLKRSIQGFIFVLPRLLYSLRIT
ncbi:hypothetical protein GE21DRAFT_1233122 [Neurospora crassa]|nr:hypothetical protein GE21DRAFT_1233122 [Neurospora crassa]